jgi:hypothetical protein
MAELIEKLDGVVSAFGALGVTIRSGWSCDIGTAGAELTENRSKPNIAKSRKMMG